MTRLGGRPNFSEYRTVGEAAEYLGVSTATLRNWDRSGKLKPRRHPQNGYRIYLHEDLEAVLRSADLSSLTDESYAPPVDWNSIGESEHLVQFYESAEYLVESLSNFIGTALSGNRAAVVIATEERRRALLVKLSARGVATSEAVDDGRFVVLDAAETLAEFMVDGSPDRARFMAMIEPIMARLRQGGRRIHAFGEMVALLWADGNREAAIRLEELWNELGQSHKFALLCAYPIAVFGDESHELPFNGICNCHTRVIPAESYADLSDADQRLRAITLLQQKARSLETEIEHRRIVEQSLLQRERELADFFENGLEGMHKVGPDGTILWANKAECNLLGYTIDEYVGRPIADFHADANVIDDLLRKLKRGEAVENYPARLLCKNGTVKHVLITSSGCFENDSFLYSRCFTRDVTPQWNAESALREADRRKDEFLATLAHELRNPLAPIKNALEMMKAASGTGGAVSADVRNILERQVGQMVRLVDDLLDVSRITRDRIELRKERVDLATVVKTAVETSMPLIKSSEHQLQICLPPKPVWVIGDPTRLSQVFANLLNNSAKYTERGGRIELSVEPRDGQVTVTVSDNGVGIACDELAYVFDMFRQVDRSLERSQGGLGIGLTLVRRLVELHGGSIQVLSDGPGKGSSFVVTFSTVEAEREMPNKPATPTAAAAPRWRILVVDDNRDSAVTMSMLLKCKGHEVRTASDGREAIAVGAEFLPEIILTDVGMPFMNGFEATRQIRQLPWGKDIFIVALTGWGQEDDLAQSAEVGCSAHLVKPVDLPTLDRLLATYAASLT